MTECIEHYVPLPVAARQIGISPGRLRQLVAARRVVGARRVGRDWLVPVPVRIIALPRGRRPRR
ncbi:MAG: hypothetical protein KatS3mg051_2301 [Anaerolineae bacterium]|nr:MAG: hypothetical protein KatS3mg051_2301 [Anaerolineae bacterium]